MITFVLVVGGLIALAELCVWGADRANTYDLECALGLAALMLYALAALVVLAVGVVAIDRWAR
jgi:hypothetical protein